MSQKVEAKKATTKSAKTTVPSALEAVIDSADLINIQSESSMTKTTQKIQQRGARQVLFPTLRPSERQSQNLRSQAKQAGLVAGVNELQPK
jgi:hypothetical protein